ANRRDREHECCRLAEEPRRTSSFECEATILLRRRQPGQRPAAEEKDAREPRDHEAMRAPSCFEPRSARPSGQKRHVLDQRRGPGRGSLEVGLDERTPEEEERREQRGRTPEG